jgi:ATP-dependent Clp protease ATP-binding subunit ClpC
MFDRFTETARRVLREAHEEALRRRHRSVDPEHLFLALLRQRQGIALAVLDRLGLQRDAVTEDFEGVLASVGAAAKPVTETPFGLGAAHALEQSVQQARDLESNWVGTEHLLLGLLHDGDSPVARTLGAHRVRFETAFATVLTLLGKSTGSDQGHPHHD